MALIPFPSAARITAMSLQQLYVGDVTHRSIYTGAQQTLARAPGRWTGSVDIAVTDTAADRGAIEAWLAALRGTVNLTELPLVGRTGTSTAQDRVGFTAATLAAAALIDDPAGTDIYELDTQNGPQPDGSVWSPLEDGSDLPTPGEYLRIGARVYCVLEASMMLPWVMTVYGTMQPAVRIVPGVRPSPAPPGPVVVRSGASVRAQLQDEAPVLPLDGEYAGPWSLSWIEQP